MICPDSLNSKFAYFEAADVFQSILIKKNLSILLAIIIAASSLSIVSYQYSAYTSEEVSRIASDDVVLNAQNEAYDLSRIVVNKIDAVTTNLQVLANAPSIQSGDAEDISQLFDAAQYSTEDLTEYYMWLDSDGTIRTASNVARASYLYNALWQSEEPPFLTEPRKTGGIYYSGIIKSPSDNTERLYIAYPIVYSLQQNELLTGDFRGVIVASIRLDTLGTILTNELSPTFQSDVSLADITGVMVYSVDRSVIGKNIFEDPSYLTTPVLSELRGDAEAETAQFLKSSNMQRQAGVKNISTAGKTFTLASHPIIHNGNHFWTLYIIAPHVLTGNVADLLAKQDIFTMTILIVIGAISVGIAYLVLSWNKRLEATVTARTLELKNANISLTESNEQLALANDQLELHGRLQREFIDVAAHELRTPIMPILGMADILESKFRQSKNDEIILKRGDFEIVSRNARRLERLATDILDATKIETRSLRLNKEQFDLCEVAELAVDDIKNQFPSDKIRYVVQIDRGTRVFADKSKLTQVLSNLLSNAAKFTDDGSITVSGQVKTSANGQNSVRISVSDTGTGIDSEVLPRLFTKFTNKAGTDRAQIGSGLGLYISKGIIQAHGGKIWAENNEDGRGCTFWIDIPLMGQEITS
jgi:signal transduction histidine kinase